MRIYNPTTSSGGGSGETGATGASGLNAALTFAYRLDLSGTQNLETLPSQGEIRFAGGSDPFNATHLLVHKNSIDLNNVGSLFLSLERGHLTLTSQTQPNNFATYSFSQVENGSGFSDHYVIFHVSLVGQFNTLSDDDVISFGIAVTGETGATGPQGLQGPGGGGGAGGLMFYLNQNTSPDSPLTGLPTSSSVVTGFAVKELGRIANTVQSTITSSHLPTDDFNIVAAFLSDAQDPNITSIPPGLWDVNFWASSTANTNNQTVIRVIAYTYNGTSKTEIARSDDMYIYDPVVIAQYTANIVVQAGIAITANDRIYIEILAKGSSNNYTVTLKFGGNTPAHVHTTIPSVSGTGLVKVENGLFKTPASLLVDADISTDAAISLSKISGAASSANVQIFSTPGTFTWTKPAGATAVEIQLLAGGGGGGSGRKDALTTAVVKCGGGGGGGGSWLNVTLNADALDATVEVTVGGGGNGGAAQSGNADGNNGSAGGNTIFGSIIALGGNFGSGGTINTGTGGLASLNSNAGASAAVNGGSGGGGFPSGITVAWMFGGAGGGAGGGISSGNSSFAGGAGGRSNALNLTGGTLGSGVGTNGGAGSANTNASAGLIAVGSGGGGGGASATVNGGSGGAGGFPSGGGGGGGATTAGTSSGAGGAGAAGIAIITTYF